MANQFKQPMGRSASGMFCSLFNGGSDDLSEPELLAFYKLKGSLNRADEPKTVQELFRELYQLYFQQSSP